MVSKWWQNFNFWLNYVFKIKALRQQQHSRTLWWFKRKIRPNSFRLPQTSSAEMVRGGRDFNQKQPMSRSSDAHESCGNRMLSEKALLSLLKTLIELIESASSRTSLYCNCAVKKWVKEWIEREKERKRGHERVRIKGDRLGQVCLTIL